jgi:acyl dehydratase
MAPPALLAALLTACAARHSAQPGAATFLRAATRFLAPARAEETATVRATVVGVDEATGALRIAATCDAEDGRRLAEADFLLRRE